MAENGYHGVHGKLVERYGRAGDTLYTFVACVVALAVSGLAAYLTNDDLDHPNEGPRRQPSFSFPLEDGPRVHLG